MIGFNFLVERLLQEGVSRDLDSSIIQVTLFKPPKENTGGCNTLKTIKIHFCNS